MHQCPFCPKKYRRWSNYMRHAQNEHGVVFVMERPKFEEE